MQHRFKDHRLHQRPPPRSRHTIICVANSTRHRNQLRLVPSRPCPNKAIPHRAGAKGRGPVSDDHPGPWSCNSRRRAKRRAGQRPGRPGILRGALGVACVTGRNRQTALVQFRGSRECESIGVYGEFCKPGLAAAAGSVAWPTKRRQCWSPPVDAGGRDSSASDVIASAPRAASSSTSIASSAERA